MCPPQRITLRGTARVVRISRESAKVVNPGEFVFGLAWEDEDSGKAMDFVNKLLDLNAFDPSYERPWKLNGMGGTSQLNEEAMVSSPLDCSRNSIGAARDSSLWYSNLWQLLRTPKDHLRHLDKLGENAAMGAVALVNLTNKLFRKPEDGTILERLLSLEGLITRMTSFQGTAPHDTIYAVLWLARDAQPDAHDPAAMSEAQLLQTPEDSPQIDPVLSEDECSDIGMEVNQPKPRSVNLRTSFPRACSPARSVMLTQFGSSAGPWLRPPLPDLPTSFSGRSATDRSLQRAENHFQDYLDITKVDYSKSVQEVLSDFLEFAISRSKTIDIICYPWAPEPAQGEPVLPTWIFPGSAIPYDKKRKEDLYGRESADPLVGYSGQEPRNYNTSGRTRTYAGKGFISDPAFTVMRFVLDTIGTKGSPAHEGIISSTWHELVDWSGSPEPVPDQLWRTLVADKGLDGKRYLPAYFPLACKWMFEQRKHGGDVDTTKILTSAQCPSIITEFMRRVQSVVMGKRLIRTEGRRGAKQLLGLVPAKVEAGDLV
ncbi:putative Heterokaryon incompatibility protein-domain-containing protein [Seiridium cardinale]|uniref:Heterokaryon incompatibility protein-domain-containing protein n=1 Tax=Seiridium cardinale TaxID=138064 RepID=A0ABR2Y9Z3_9PEZI